MVNLSLISSIWRADNFSEIIETYVIQSAPHNQYEILFAVSNQSVYDVVCATVDKHRDKLPVVKVEQMFDLSNCVVRNKSASIAQGSRLLFIDGDQYLSSCLVHEHLKLSPGVVGIGIQGVDVLTLSSGERLVRVPDYDAGSYFAKYVSYGVMNFGDMIEKIGAARSVVQAVFNNPSNLTDCVNLSGRNCSFYKNDFLKIGGFDEDLGYSRTSKSRGWEDTAIGYTAYRAGLKFCFVPAWLLHPVHGDAFKKNDGGFSNAVAFVRKNPTFIDERPDWFIRAGVDIKEVKNALG